MYLTAAVEEALRLVVLLGVGRQDEGAFPAFPWEDAFPAACLVEAYLGDLVVDPLEAAWVVASQALALRQLEVAFQDAQGMDAYLQPLGA